MSKRDVKLWLEDFLESIEKIENCTKDVSFDAFKESGLIFDATVRNFEIIGEAANNIPEDSRSNLHKVPWKQIRGLRNRIIHEYFGVDINIVWYIIENELPDLKEEIKKALKTQ